MKAERVIERLIDEIKREQVRAQQARDACRRAERGPAITWHSATVSTFEDVLRMIERLQAPPDSEQITTIETEAQ